MIIERLTLKRSVASLGVVAILLWLPSNAVAQNTDRSLPTGQLTKTIDVRVTDANGNLIEGATVNPWALNCSQGHGAWESGQYDRTEMVAELAISGADGIAKVKYPFYRDVSERIRTIAVSILVSHPHFVMTSSIDIDVPLENTDIFDVQLEAGASLELLPTVEGKPIGSDSLFVSWSDLRSVRRFNRELKLETTDHGSIRLPPMRGGANSVLVAKIENDQATFLSEITDVNLVIGETKTIEIPLTKATPIVGKLSSMVPRPVRAGRVVLETQQPPDAHENRVSWHTWTTIQEDGSFAINAWPPGEGVRVSAICDGFHSESDDTLDRAPFFQEGEPIHINMVPMATCLVTVLDEYQYPISGVDVSAWPWTDYASSFARSEMYLQGRDDQDSYPHPFIQKSDKKGKVAMRLPAGKNTFTVKSDLYELPVLLGVRKVNVDCSWGQTQEVTLELQYRGAEQLGEWDKLAGVVFGCGTREGQRIRALPGFTEKMDAFVVRFREAKNQRDPQQLSEAYKIVAEAFAEIGDNEEASKWHLKARDQAAKVSRPN